jgi:hypothetical protein
LIAHAYSSRGGSSVTWATESAVSWERHYE